MHPILYQAGALTVRSYGLMLVLSFIVCVLLAHARAKKAGIDSRQILHLSLLIILVAVVGSRLLYVAENLSLYAADPWQALRIWEGGLSMYGGVLLAIVASYLYARAIDEPFAVMADICAPSIALGEVLTRIGCLLNGCCFGNRCDLPWGMVFPRNSLAGQAFPDTPIHPTQIYCSLYSLLILGILLAAEKKKRAPGYVIGLFLLLHATARFLVEFVRYHQSSLIPFTIGLTPAQLISLSLFTLGAYFLFAARRGIGATPA